MSKNTENDTREEILGCAEYENTVQCKNTLQKGTGS